MKNVETMTGYLGMIDRKATSRNGNPRWMVSISNGLTGRDYDCVIAYTAPDSPLAYSVGNFRPGDKVQAEIGMHYGTVTLANLIKIDE